MGNPTKLADYPPKDGRYRFVARVTDGQRKYVVGCACGCGSSKQVLCGSSVEVPAALREAGWLMSGRTRDARWWMPQHAPAGSR